MYSSPLSFQVKWFHKHYKYQTISTISDHTIILSFLRP